MEKRYQIFVSSTFDDLKLERRKVWETLITFNYIVVGMETFPATNEEQFSYIKKQILGSDYYVLILAGRYGTMADEQLSYTEKEFGFALESGIPILVFPIDDPSLVEVRKTDQDYEKQKKLEQFRLRTLKGRNVFKWTNADNLALGIIQALQHAVEATPRPGWVRGDAPSNESLLGEIRELARAWVLPDLRCSIRDNLGPDDCLHRALTAGSRVPFHLFS
jgi:Domain of unknown function (DUF4062)